jgi:hypothetical protein
MDTGKLNQYPIGSINPTNLLTNGDFEVWSAGASAAPDGWTVSGGSVAREGTIKKISTYSVKLTNTGNYLYQDVHAGKGIEYFKGRTLTLGVWVYASVGSRVQVAVNDGVGASSSSFHTGDSTWQFLSVIHSVNSSATQVRCILYMPDGTSISAYFDGAMCVEGSSAVAFSDKPMVYGDTRFAGITVGGQDVTHATYDVSYTGYGFSPKSLQFMCNRDRTIYFSIGWAIGTGAGQGVCIGSPGGAGGSVTIFEVYGYLASPPIIAVYVIDASNHVMWTLKSIDKDGYTLTQTKTGSPTGGATLHCLASR